MQTNEIFEIYVVNFHDDDRKNRMISRFASCDLSVNFVDPVYTSDPRIAAYDISDFERRSWTIFFQHQDSVRHFYEKTSADYCIVCEDDVYISRTLKTDLQEVMCGFREHGFDILLLGYLWPYSLENDDNPYFPRISSSFPTGNTHQESSVGNGKKIFYRKYPDDLWGAHMYMVSREHAGKMLERYTPEYAFSCVGTPHPFCTDWQFTKWGNRALVVPMLGIEEGEVKTDHQGQADFHRWCCDAHYSEEKYV
jgi:hypothetical protein